MSTKEILIKGLTANLTAEEGVKYLEITNLKIRVI